MLCLFVDSWYGSTTTLPGGNVSVENFQILFGLDLLLRDGNVPSWFLILSSWFLFLLGSVVDTFWGRESDAGPLGAQFQALT